MFGFEVPEMIAYMRSEWETNSYFVETPANFTISRLFPIKDTDRIQMTWDLLAFHQAQVAKGRGKYAEIAEEKVRIGKCTHITTRQFYEKSGICETCLLLGSKWEILKDPAVALALLPEDQTEMRAMATWFLRDPMVDFNLADYWERTYPLRAEIWKEFGKKLNAKNPFISFGMK